MVMTSRSCKVYVKCGKCGKLEKDEGGMFPARTSDWKHIYDGRTRSPGSKYMTPVLEIKEIIIVCKN